MLLDIEELFRPYTKDGCTVELTINWLAKEGATWGFDHNVISCAMAEVFTEIKNGRSFLGKCDCGCSLENVHTYLNHYLLRRCKGINEDLAVAKREAIEERMNGMILAHIHDQNEKYIAEKFPNGEPLPVVEIEEKWKTVLLKQDAELQERERDIVLKEKLLRENISAFNRQQEEAKEQKPSRWKIWKKKSK